jgi:hypothetical protein
MPPRPKRHACTKSTVLCGVVAEDDADPPPSQELRQPLLAVAQWHVPKVLAVEFEKVEGVQHGLADGAAAVERVEDRDPIGAQTTASPSSARSGRREVGSRGVKRRTGLERGGPILPLFDSNVSLNVETEIERLAVFRCPGVPSSERALV